LRGIEGFELEWPGEQPLPDIRGSRRRGRAGDGKMEK